MWAESIVACFESNDAAERAVCDKPSNSLKIAVVAAVLIDGEQAIRILRKLHERNSLFKSCCKRFVDDHVAACRKALPRDRKVRVVRRGDDHKANLRNREQFVQVPDDSNVRIFLRRLCAATLHDGGEMQTRHSANHRRVERTAGETETYEADFNH